MSVKPGLPFYQIKIPYVRDNEFIAPYEQNVNNALLGVTERVLFTDARGTLPPKPDILSVRSLLPVAAKLARLCRLEYIHRLDLLQYAEARPTRTRKRYTKLVNEMLSKNVTGLDSLCNMGLTLNGISKTRAFIKLEGTVHTQKKINVCRIINPRSSTYNVLLGRYLSHNEGHILKTFDLLYGHSDVMMKGKTVFERARIVENYFSSGLIAYSIDMSRFDQHVNKELLKVEHSVYKKMFGYDTELCKLLSKQLDTFMSVKSADGSFDVKAGSMRCSGDVNTSLGNCILMGLMCFGLLKPHMRLMCDGDDTIIWAKPGDLDEQMMSDHFKKFGMTMTMEGIATVPEDLTFCQHHFVRTPDGLRMVRSPYKAMMRDVMAFGANGADITSFRKLLSAVGDCGMSQYYGLPVLQSLYLMNKRIGIASRQTIFRELSRTNFGMGRAAHRDYTPIACDTRVSFWLATGMEPVTQVAIEQWCQTFDLDDTVVDGALPEWHSTLFVNSCPTPPSVEEPDLSFDFALPESELVQTNALLLPFHEFNTPSDWHISTSSQ